MQKQLPRNAGGKVHVRVRVRRLVHFVVAAAAAAATIPATGTQPHAAAVVEGRDPALPACLHSSLSQFTVLGLYMVQYRISTDIRCGLSRGPGRAMRHDPPKCPTGPKPHAWRKARVRSTRKS